MPAWAAEAEPPKTAEVPLTTLPRQGGLPVKVAVAVSFLKIGSIEENEGKFDAMVDLRLRWKDSRLKGQSANGFREFQGEAAVAQVAEIWVPKVELSNQSGDPAFETQVLRISDEGEVEWTRRVEGEFKSVFDPSHFPFDRQKLAVSAVVRGDSLQEVMLDYRQGDLNYSRLADGVAIDGWRFGLVDLRRQTEAGFYGKSHAGLVAELEVRRILSAALAPIFIPLFASLLIPLMAIYLNKVEDGEFKIEAFELSNIVIGGLFAVIALNFTVNSEYPALGGSDNPVTRLFALNYLVLGVALAIIIMLFRFNLVQRMLGKYVQEQLYLCIIWAGPFLVAATALAILLAAAA
jgi:hypothetical protein